MTQAERVIELLNAGPLDYMKAKENGIGQLKTRISQLRKSGVKIANTMHKGFSEKGKVFMYAVYTLAEPKQERITTRVYTCAVGEVVYFEGKKMFVQEVLEEGSERGKIKAYIKGCFLHADGTPAERTNAFAGYDWVR